jgi:hypothetical protein
VKGDAGAAASPPEPSAFSLLASPRASRYPPPLFLSEPLEETADRARILTTANSSGRIQVTALVRRFLQFSIACFVSVATHPEPCVPGFSVLVLERTHFSQRNPGYMTPWMSCQRNADTFFSHLLWQHIWSYCYTLVPHIFLLLFSEVDPGICSQSFCVK